MKKIVAVFISISLCFTLVSCKSQPSETFLNYKLEDYYDFSSMITDEKNYISVFQELESKLTEGKEYIYSPKDYKGSDNEQISFLPIEESLGYEEEVLYIPPKSEVEFVVNVSLAGGYHIALDYLIPDESLENLEISLMVNGELPYKEAASIKLPALWKDVQEEIRFDEYDNQIYSTPERVYSWQSKTLNHSLYLLKTPLIFELKEGENKITIKTNHVPVLLGKITLKGKDQRITYNTYKQQFENASLGSDFIVIEAEDYSFKSESYIRGERSRNVNFYPHDYKKNLINVLDKGMWAEPSERVEYSFTIKDEGIYYIVLKYQQNSKSNMPVFKNIYLDGEIVFDELSEYRFDYSKNNVNHIYL